MSKHHPSDDLTRPISHHQGDTVPQNPTPPPRGGIFNWLVPLLAAIVALNILLTVVLMGYYGQARVRAVSAGQPPPEPVAVLATLVPFPVEVAQPTETPDPLPPVPQGVVYFLLMGIDARPDQIDTPTRTDTMIVVRLDFENNTARLLSFPRDLWLAMPPEIAARGTSVARINQGYYYGELYDIPGGGPRGAQDTVTLNFGIPLHGYALVNFQGFVGLVDAIGGIDVDVPEAIYDPSFPTDDYRTIILDIPAGPNHFDGITALRYARTRHQDSDLQRNARQQLVLLGIRDAALQLDIVTRGPSIWQALEGQYTTNFELTDAIAYGLAAQQIPRDNIETYRIDQTMLVAWNTPGGANVWIPQNRLIAPVIEQFMAP